MTHSSIADKKRSKSVLSNVSYGKVWILGRECEGSLPTSGVGREGGVAPRPVRYACKPQQFAVPVRILGHWHRILHFGAPR